MNLNEYHRYINLRSRPDRDILCKEQLKGIGISEPKRYNAFKTKDGIIGCGMSHLSVLQEAKDNNYPYILICEDDVVFKDHYKMLEKIDNLKNDDWDVLLLGGNMFSPYSEYSDDAYRIHRCFTTTAYIVRNHYYDKLIDTWQPSLQKLVKTGNRDYSLDVAWFPLQERDKWLLIRPLQVYQRPDKSDIENRITDYRHLMLSEKK
jgi:GR25 family glycosyltransferase involved in LPS biosynthesis